MHKFRSVFSIAALRTRDLLCSARTVVIAILIGIFVYSAVEPFAQFARSAAVPFAPFIAPMLIDDQICQLFLLLGAVALFSSAPFKDEFHPYLVVRAGKTAVVLGNALGILMASAVYVAFIYAISLAPALDILTFEPKWGKVITTLAAYPIAGLYFIPSESIRVGFQPVQAMIIGGLLEVLCVSLLGTLIYFGNLLTGRPVGLWLASAIAVLDITIYNYLPDYVNAFSPAALARLSTYVIGIYMPFSGSLGYGFIFIGVFIIGLLALSWFYETVRKDIA